MSKPKIYINKKISAEVERYLSNYFDCFISEKPLNEIEKKELDNIEGVLTAGTKIDKEFLDFFPKVKVISNMSVGYNNFNIKDMRRIDVVGTHTPYVLEETVADLAFGLMISTARRIPELNNYVKRGDWGKDSETSLFGMDVNNTTLGIIGMGRIGRVIAKRAIYGFNMEVLYHNRNRNKNLENDTGVTYSSLTDLLKKSDYVILLIPLNDQTRHYINYEHFQIMKDTSIFINISRGETINEIDLIKALKENQIKAAGLDVFNEEPTSPDNPLLKMKNVVCLPHVGTATLRTRNKIAMLAAQNLVNVILKKDYSSAHIVKELQ